MKIKGRSTTVSKSFIRAWLHAAATVLSFHGNHVDMETLLVEIKDLSDRVNKVTGKGVGGTANWSKNKIELMEEPISPDHMATIILHEMIHIACKDFGGDARQENSLEKCTSTLTAKLKPTVQALAQVLHNRQMQNAAYIAHTKRGMAYRNRRKKDYYDKAQWTKTGAKDKRFITNTPFI